MKKWICKGKLKDGSICEQEVYASQKPQPMMWNDGHTCSFEEDTQ